MGLCGDHPCAVTFTQPRFVEARLGRAYGTPRWALQRPRNVLLQKCEGVYRPSRLLDSPRAPGLIRGGWRGLFLEPKGGRPVTTRAQSKGTRCASG